MRSRQSGPTVLSASVCLCQPRRLPALAPSEPEGSWLQASWPGCWQSLGRGPRLPLVMATTLPSGQLEPHLWQGPPPFPRRPCTCSPGSSEPGPHPSGWNRKARRQMGQETDGPITCPPEQLFRKGGQGQGLLPLVLGCGGDIAARAGGRRVGVERSLLSPHHRGRQGNLHSGRSACWGSPGVRPGWKAML